MAENKYISQLTGNTNPILTGYTIFDDGTTTYKTSLNTLRQVLVDSGSHYFTGSQTIKGDLTISGSLTAQQYIVSSSVTHINNINLNGSSINGNDLSDTHQFTGSVGITGSLNIIGDLSSSFFVGNGSRLTDLPISVSGTTNHIAFFNTTSSVTSSDRFHVVNDGETISLGTTAFTNYEPERFLVDNGDSFNIATFQASSADSYTQVNIKNFNSGPNASADLVLWNDLGTESSSYVDLGINSSTNNGSSIGYSGDAYLYTRESDLYIGSLGWPTHGHVHIFGGGRFPRPQISVFNDKTIGFNINIIDTGSLQTIPSSLSGFTYEFSGSVKLDNNLKVDGTITASLLDGYIWVGNSGNTSTMISTGSIVSTGGSGSFTGSFIGDGSGLTNLPISVSGSTDHLAFFNTSTSVTSSDRFHLINNNESLGLGTTAFTNYEPERLVVDNGDSFNIATFQASSADSYTQVNIKNFNSGANASADLVLWNDVGTESSSYVDLGINSSTNNGSSIGYAGDAYLYTRESDLYIGSLGFPTHGHLHLFGGGRFPRPQISIFNDRSIGFNINQIDTGSLQTIPSSINGYLYEFSGSVKLDNDLKVDGSLLIGRVSEEITVDGGFSGNRDFDYTSGSIFYLTGLTGNGTWNINNVPTTENKGITLTFLVEQGVTAYSASAFTFNSSAITVKWVDSIVPTGSANKTDIIGLTAFRVGSSWNVLGSLSSFGS
jgi:cytoskeletal protein CcmA (bactofilin family)